MTAPLNSQGIMPYPVKLQITAGQQNMTVVAEDQDSTASNPSQRIVIPPGMTTVQLVGNTRYGAELVWVPGSQEQVVGEIPPSSVPKMVSVTVSSPSVTEVYVRLKQAMNSSDRASGYGAGLRILPTPPKNFKL